MPIFLFYNHCLYSYFVISQGAGHFTQAVKVTNPHIHKQTNTQTHRIAKVVRLVCRVFHNIIQKQFLIIKRIVCYKAVANCQKDARTF